ncbi:hypothetical protein EMCRGX_G018690 [Ephydatia muelleri]
MAENMMHVTQISLSSASLNGTTVTLTSPGTVVTSSNQRTVVIIALNAHDLLATKYSGMLAYDPTDTYLSLPDFTISDTAGMPLGAISYRQATSPNQLIPDSSRMKLLEFSLNMLTRTLSLTFDDVANPLTCSVTGITILNAPAGSIQVPLSSGSTVATMQPDFVVVISLSVSDALALTSAQLIATQVANTYLALTETTIMDKGGETVTPLDEFGQNSFTFTGGNITYGLSAVIRITTNDLNALKALETVATSASNTYLNFIGSAFVNLFALPVVLSEPARVTVFIPDTNPPSLLSFDLDMNTGSMILHFNETIKASTVIVQGAVLSSFGLQSPSMITLSAGQPTSPNGASITVLGFSIDLGNNLLFLTFTEIVNVSTLMPTQFWLQDTINDTHSYQLPNSVVGITTNQDVINMTLQLPELDSIQANGNIGISLSSTFLRFTTAAVFDLAGNAINGSVVQATQVVQDKTNPLLLSCTLNLTSGFLDLVFNKVVQASATQLSLITVQDQPFSPIVQVSLSNQSSFELTNSRILRISLGLPDFDPIRVANFTSAYINLSYAAVSDMSGNGNLPSFLAVLAYIYPDYSTPQLLTATLKHDKVISSSASTVVISLAGDLNPLRATSMLYKFATSVNNTYITIAAVTAFDFASNPAPSIVTPRQIDIFIPDTVGPVLSSAKLDMNQGVLTLCFVETVISSNFNSTLIAFQNARTNFALPSYIPITSTTFQQINYTCIAITLSSLDVDSLNLVSYMATSTQDTFITLMPSTVQDVAGNRAPAITTSNAFQITQFIPDMVNPNITRFQIDLTNNTITLSFSKVVNPLSINMSAISLLDSSLNTSRIGSFSGYMSATRSRRTIIITLYQQDVNTLNALGVCYNISTCYAQVQKWFITDKYGNPVLATAPIKASNFTNNTKLPVFVQFLTFDVNSGILVLQFSETIAKSSVKLNTLKLQSTSNGSGVDFTSQTLTGGTVAATSSNIAITMTMSDLNALKSNKLLCRLRSQCYIRFPINFAQNIFGTQLASAIGNSLLPNSRDYPLDFIGDTTGPILFSEKEITIQNGFLATASYTLTGSSSKSFNVNIVTVQLLSIDDLSIKGIPGLATSVATTYLVHPSTLVSDVIGNPAVARSDGVNPLQATQLANDTTSPVFFSFAQYSSRGGELLLQFSEPIDYTKVNYSLITLQSTASSSMGTLLQLSPGTATLDSTKLVLIITLSLSDQLYLKLQTSLAVNKTTTYISFKRGAFADHVGLYTTANTSVVATYRASTAAPTLIGFTLDMQNAQLFLTYDDLINPSVYSPQGITIQSSQQLYLGPHYTLTGGTAISNSTLGFVVYTNLTLTDLLNLKYTQRLAKNLATTYIDATPATTVDRNGGVVTQSVVQATAYIRDTTSPNVVAFYIDLNAGLLQIIADEPLDPNSYTPSGFIFQNTPNASTMFVHTVMLTGGMALQASTPIVQINIQLDNYDLNALKEQPDFVSDRIYLSLTASAFADFSGNPVVPISGMAAINISSFTADTTPPTVSLFILDFNTGKVTFQL